MEEILFRRVDQGLLDKRVLPEAHTPKPVPFSGHQTVVHDDAEFLQRRVAREGLGQGPGQFIELVVHTFSLLEDEAAVSCDDNAFHRPISLATQGGRKLGGHFDRSRTSGSSESPSPADERHLIGKVDE